MFKLLYVLLLSGIMLSCSEDKEIEQEKSNPSSIKVKEKIVNNFSQNFIEVEDITIDNIRTIHSCFHEFDTKNSTCWDIIGEYSENIVPDSTIKLLEIYYWDINSSDFNIKDNMNYKKQLIAVSKFYPYAKNENFSFIVDPNKTGKYKLDGKTGKIE